VIRTLLFSTAAALVCAGPATSQPAVKAPVIKDVIAHVEEICAPRALLRARTMIRGCHYWDKTEREVPGPPRISGGYPDVMTDLKLTIDRRDDAPPIATFNYGWRYHSDDERNGTIAVGVIESDPNGGLIVRIKDTRGQTGIAHLELTTHKAIVRGLAEISNSPRYTAEPMDFSMDRDPENLVKF
jgi:hypothetical protein